ncbi:MAG: asparagine synthase-related protein [Acidobacteriota bacterium]
MSGECVAHDPAGNGRCGDWLLLVDGLATPPAPRRSGAWRAVFSGGGRTLYLAPPRSPGWVGSPLRDVALVDGDRAWVFGDVKVDGPAIDRAFEDGDFSALGGRFLLLAWVDGAFEVVTDRFNTLHAYSLGDDDRAVGSSFFAVSATSQRRLDWLALTTFFACGFFLAGGTFWDDVRCFEPARRYRLGSARSGERHWRWRHGPETRRGPTETVEEFADVFARVVTDASAGGVALPLSGGLDSRALCAAAPASDLRWSFGYGYRPDSVEIRIARRLAEVRGLAFGSFVIEPYLADRVETALELLEGFQDVTQTRQLAIASTLAQRAGRVLGGHWGDVWLDDMGLDPRADESQVLAHTLRKLRKRGRRWLLEHLCAPALGADPEAQLEARVGEELRPYGEIGDADFRLKAFKTDHWSSRWTLGSVRAYQAAAWPVLPFYDPRLTDFFATVPTAQLVDRRLELDYLLRFAPELARVPWQETGAGLHRSRRAAYWLGLPRRAVAKAWRTARRRPVLERNWEVQLLSPSGRRLLDERLLAPGLRLHDLVAPTAVRALLDDFFARPDAGLGYVVSMLLTFAVFLERA